MIEVKGRSEYLDEVKKLINSKPTCAELGVHLGEFSHLVLEILQPAKLILIDPYGKEIGPDIQPIDYGDGQIKTVYSTEEDYYNLLKRFKDEIKQRQVIVVRDYSYNVADNYYPHYFDMVYIDSCHLYECVKKDLNLYYPKLKENGFMCGHDYDWIDVRRAVDEFCDENNLQIVLLNDDVGYDWAIQLNN